MAKEKDKNDMTRFISDIFTFRLLSCVITSEILSREQSTVISTAAPAKSVLVQTHSRPQSLAHMAAHSHHMARTAYCNGNDTHNPTAVVVIFSEDILNKSVCFCACVCGKMAARSDHHAGMSVTVRPGASHRFK